MPAWAARVLAREPAILAPDPDGAFASEQAINDGGRHELVVAAREPPLRRVKGRDIRGVFQERHKPLELGTRHGHRVTLDGGLDRLERSFVYLPAMPDGEHIEEDRAIFGEDDPIIPDPEPKPWPTWQTLHVVRQRLRIGSELVNLGSNEFGIRFRHRPERLDRSLGEPDRLHGTRLPRESHGRNKISCQLIELFANSHHSAPPARTSPAP